MKGTDRLILMIVPMVALAVGFWILVLAPKVKEAGELQTRSAELQTAIDASEAEIAASELARAAFPGNYADLVSLGAAVPEKDEQATLIQTFAGLARDESVNFRSFELVPGPGVGQAVSAEAAVPADPAAAQPEVAATPAVTAAPATEATAAALPIGSTVGPAGLPVTPYKLDYKGRFFDLADLFAGLDDGVDVRAKASAPPVVHGRLITIDGFVLKEDEDRGFPTVSAELNVTTYLVPEDQGIAAGATPTGPAPLGSAAADATVTSTSTGAAVPPTATVTP